MPQTADEASHHLARIRLAPVGIGRDFGNSIEIVSGLEAGERLVANPPDSAVDGETVRIVAGAHGAKP